MAMEAAIHISGELDAANVPIRLHESKAYFASGHDVVIDLAGVTRADSAGVALLLDWLRQARAAQVRLTFANAPTQMRSIIDFCSLGDVIPIHADDNCPSD